MMALFLFLQTITAIIIYLHSALIWESMTTQNIWLTSCFIINALIYLIHAIQNSWNYFKLIDYTLKEVSITFRMKIQILFWANVLYVYLQSNDSYLKMAFMNLYTNKFYVYFFRALRLSTHFVFLYYFSTPDKKELILWAEQFALATQSTLLFLGKMSINIMKRLLFYISINNLLFL